MAGTKAGGEKAAITNKQRYGEDFYEKIGSKGGSVSGPRYRKGGETPVGFASDPDFAREAGAKGGRSRKGYRKHHV